jgi:hypothetical protein
MGREEKILKKPLLLLLIEATVVFQRRKASVMNVYRRKSPRDYS